MLVGWGWVPAASRAWSRRPESHLPLPAWMLGPTTSRPAGIDSSVSSRIVACLLTTSHRRHAAGRARSAAVHSAERGARNWSRSASARALRREYDLVIAVGMGPLRAAFTQVAAAVVRGPTNLPIWGAKHCRWALQIGRAIPDAVRFAALVRRNRIDVVVVNSTVLVSPVIGARLAGSP